MGAGRLRGLCAPAAGPVDRPPAAAAGPPATPPATRRPLDRRRGPPHPPAARRAAGPVAVAGARPTTTGSAGWPTVGGAGASTAWSAACSTSIARTTGHDRADRGPDGRRHRGAATRHASRRSSTAASLVEETRRHPGGLDRPAPGSAPSSRPCRGSKTLEWFGTGPHETYPDRKRGGLVGRWRSTVTDQYVPYIRPQENGGHADVRWLALTDGTAAACGSSSAGRRRSRPPITAPPTSPRRPTTSSSCRGPRRSSTSTPRTAGSAPPAAGRTRCPRTSSGPARTAGSWTLRPLERRSRPR